MKEIRVPLEEFDLESFFNRTVKFLRGQVSAEVHPSYAIVSVGHPGDVPVFGPEAGWDVLSALKLGSKKVFFPFAHTDAEGTLTCADGNVYGPTSEEEDSAEGFFIGLEDSVGYLVQAKGGTVIVNSAIHAGGGCPGPAPRVDIHPGCGVLGSPMEKFTRSFLKG